MIRVTIFVLGLSACTPELSEPPGDEGRALLIERDTLEPEHSSAKTDAAGGPHYCSALETCGEGEGDCDATSECDPGLVCRANVGEEYGWSAITDVCEETRSGDGSYCSETSPCSEGEGDCDATSECEAGLACRANVGAGYGWSASTDVCEAFVVGENGFCSPDSPCSHGQGDCDQAGDCQLGLACVHNVGMTSGFSAEVDVCL